MLWYFISSSHNNYETIIVLFFVVNYTSNECHLFIKLMSMCPEKSSPSQEKAAACGLYKLS